MSEATEVKELSSKEVLVSAILEITKCDEEQANQLFTAIDVLFMSRLQEMFSDPKVLQDIYLNMQSIQLQNVGKYRALEPQLNARNILIIDEENEATNLRVKYVSEDTATWTFEQRVDGVWSELEVAGKERASLIGTAGKFFDGRTDRLGYYIDSVALDKLATK